MSVAGGESLKLEWSICSSTYSLRMINFVILLILITCWVQRWKIRLW